MPYTNIYWVKLKLEILNDKRFIFDCDNSQKWLYVGLLLLAGATQNNIPIDENYLKNRLNLPENTPKIKENVAFLLKTFPKLISKNGHLKFKNFKALHNRVGKTEGSPKEVQKDTQIRAEQISKIRVEYLSLKNLSLKDFTSTDYARTGKTIKTLICRAEGKDDLVIEGLRWASNQKWCDWTLETLNRRWVDFKASKNKKPERAIQDL